jgi:soluble lytic murein transglycosylase
MKTKHLNSILLVIAGSLALVLFNNFAFISWSGRSMSIIEQVHEASRISHAKELLGSGYKGSDAQKMEGEDTLNQMILEKIQMGLAPRWKNQAHAIASTVITESAKYKVDPIFVLALIKTESKFDPLVVGSFGEIGLMQIKPDTAEWIAKKNNIPWAGKKTLQNPTANIRIGLAYMNYLRGKFEKTPMKYVSAYNMGPLNVKRLIAKNIKPAEYSGRVMKNYQAFYSGIAHKNLVAAVAAN